MSEYQYYEFVAVDQALRREDMAELRSRSSRATITATRFVNEYQWGSLKANPADWLRRYFDAYLYTSNWGGRQLSLRLPLASLDKTDLLPFSSDDALTIDTTSTHWILNWNSGDGEENYGDDMADGSGWMSRLLPLRDELLRGDVRSLYLAWLAGLFASDLDEDVLEPPLPAGLAQLSDAQQTLVDFLQIDPDLLTAAAQASAPLDAARNQSDSAKIEEINAYVSTLPAQEMHALLSLLLQGQSQRAERQIKTLFLSEQKRRIPKATSAPAPRTVATLYALAEEAEQHRLDRIKEERTRIEIEKRKQREIYLNRLSANLTHCWQALHQQVERATAAAYDQAHQSIADLAEAYTLNSDRKTFDTDMREFMQSHTKRGAFVRRLVESGLWRK